MTRTARRLAQIAATRQRLNEAGEMRGHWYDPNDPEPVALDTWPYRNSSAWNRKRIRVRNRCNAILASIPQGTKRHE